LKTASQRRAAFRTMTSKTGCASVRESLMTAQDLAGCGLLLQGHGQRQSLLLQELACRFLSPRALRQALLQVADPGSFLLRWLTGARSLRVQLTLCGFCPAAHRSLLASHSSVIDDRLGERARLGKQDGWARRTSGA